MSNDRDTRRPHAWSRIGPIAAVACLIGVAAPKVALAQVRVGPSIGYEFDDTDYFILLGAEARAKLAALPIEIDPRFSFQPADNVDLLQFDVNALYDLPLAHTSTFLPYAGVGVAFQHITGGGGNYVGYNLIWGTYLQLHSSWQPFAQFEYSVIIHEPNPAVIAVGALYSFGGHGGGAR
jgi:hypothetical protein